MARVMRNGEEIIEMASESGLKTSSEISISKDKKEKISDLLIEMSKLTNLEKLYMHLKLPPCPIIEEELKKSDSPPSGTASKTSTTLNWIQTHYVEDKRLCLPKQDVYSHYKLFCDSNGINPFAMTDFSKILKSAFPSVHDRRLGQRGKSKYFYGGLRRKSHNTDNKDPESSKIEDPQVFDHEEELESLSSQLVCEWASCLLGKTFSSIKCLAQYLVFTGASCGQKAALFNMFLDMDGWGFSSTVSDKKNTESILQDTQALLQRKLLQKEVLKEHKHLLKHQETRTNPREAQVSHPTVARLAVLSPSLHALHSSDASISHPSVGHVLNVTRNNSNSSSRLESSSSDAGHNIRSSTSLDGFFVDVKSRKSTVHQSEKKLSNINKNIPHHDIETQIDQAKGKTKQSKLVTSKSLEESSQRQPKRNGDFLNNASHGRNSKRRRCITSLGMAELKEQSSESDEHNTEEQRESTLMRPVSCPVFNCDMQNFIGNNLENEDMETTTIHPTMSQAAKLTEEAAVVSDVFITTTDDEQCATLKSENNSPSSFHFVRKPTVITIKPHETNENVEPFCTNVNDRRCDSDGDGCVDSLKKSNHVLNSILSSSDSNIPQSFSSSNKVPSLAPSSTGCDITASDNVCDNRDRDKVFRREAHTLDNAYLLPCQSSRSAFVRVMNGKGNRLGHEINPRPRHSSFDDSLFQANAKPIDSVSLLNLQNNKSTVAKKDLISNSIQDSSLEVTTDTAKKSSLEVSDCAKDSSGDNFKPIAESLLSTDGVLSDVVKVKTSTSLAASSTKLISSESTAQLPLAQTTCHNNTRPTATTTTTTSQTNSKRLTSKSPVITPPKRHQSRSRFTPIRPKITGCCNVSPQKKDMRPVATILKEQRARSAQELLVNLASSYQGGIKVQLPPDLLALSSPDKTSSTPSVIGPVCNQNLPSQTTAKDFTVILEPVSVSNPITTQVSPLLSPHKLIPSTPEAKMTSPASSTLSNLLTGPIISDKATMSLPANQYGVIPSSSTVISSSHSIPIQSLNSPIIVADAKGTMYSLGNADSGKHLPKISSLQQILQGSTDKNMLPATTPLKHHNNLINVSDIKGQVVGPDAQGQTYLLVPNSESATLRQNDTVPMLIASPTKQRHSVNSSLTQNSGISSSALLSELSHLASVSNQDNAKLQQPIKHDSAISAFQKCEPNKAIVTVSACKKSQPVCDSGTDKIHRTKLNNEQESGTAESLVPPKQKKEVFSKCDDVSHDEIYDVQEAGAEICLRKRKASKSQDDKLNEKKRHNIKDSEVEDVEFVSNSDERLQTVCKEECNNSGNKGSGSITREEETLISKDISEVGGVSKSGDKTNSLDAEALLDLISDSRSMTVKQTVMAMNSLKARIKKSGADQCSEEKDKLSDKDGTMENVAKDSRKAEKTALHVIRRNTSLNLESLESDALLDTELSLDHHLVGDMKLSKKGRSDHKTVAVAAKSNRSRSADRQKDQTGKGNDLHQLPTISSKALQSYQMILNEKKNKSQKDKTSDMDGSGKIKTSSVERQSKECSRKEDRVVKEQTSQRRRQRRCVSSVQDVLKSGPKRSSTALKSQNIRSQSEVDAFDALLSKMHSKQFSTNNENAVRSHSSLFQDSELPVDIVDFVTESMSSRRDSLEGNSCFDQLAKGTNEHRFDLSKFQSLKSQENIGARSVSVPNTKPDFIDIGQTRINLAVSGFSSTSAFRMDSSQLFLQPSAGENIFPAGETGNSTNKNVFLSPVGPAKLARRSSVEKSMAHGQQDRSATRTPVEMLSSPNSGSTFNPNKEKHTADPCSNSKVYATERQHCTKTPVDRTLVSGEKNRSQTPIMQLVDNVNRSPVNRILSKTPVDKYFVKQSSDPLPPRSEPFPVLSNVSREDTSSAQTVISDGGYSTGSGSVSQTPSSDFGHSSVSQTPSSDFGYSSVSPSPVMMSSASYIGECGRNISPATIFMPLRSDSALSLSNNTTTATHRSESPTNNSQSISNNRIENLPGFANNVRNTGLPPANKKDESDNLPQFTSLLDSLSSKGMFLNDVEGKEESHNVIKSSSNTKTLLKLLTSSLQSIPTPPVSPSPSPSNTLPPLPFSIPSPHQLPCPSSSPLQLSTVPCFVPPISISSNNCSSSHHSVHQGRQVGISPQFRSQDLPSPALVSHSHSYTPSPHIIARPPSSPSLQYSSHPSPPFTPCSLKSLPSPRCMTPVSHKSLISPHSVTPSTESNQAAPNRFMPIQSSGVLPTSLTTTHTYIQPIRPVVALASASSNHNNNNNGSDSNSRVYNTSQLQQNSVTRTAAALSESQTVSHYLHSQRSFEMNPNLHCVPTISSLPRPNSSSQSFNSTPQHVNGVDVIRTSEHKPLESNSTLILSLSGEIEPLPVGNSESQHHQKDLSKLTSSLGKQSDVTHYSKESSGSRLKRNQHFQQQSPTIPSQSPYPQLQHAKQKEQSFSSSLSSYQTPSLLSLSHLLPNNSSNSRSLINSSSSSSRAFKPPLNSSSSSSSSSVCSFQPVVSKSTTTSYRQDFSQLALQLSQPTGADTQQNTRRTGRTANTNSIDRRPQDSENPWATNQPVPNFTNDDKNNNSHNNSQGNGNSLNPTTQDELQATLDVLKDMDSQYFQ